MVDADAITIWRFEDAPADLQALSWHGGDEDWIALVPLKYAERHYIGWLERIDTTLDPQIVDHPSVVGYQVWIGAHA